MNRRKFVSAIAAGAALGKSRGATASGSNWEGLVLERGRHLFVDNYLVSDARNLRTTLHPPVKREQPVLLGIGSAYDNFQPFATTLYDAALGRFRMWYCTRKELKGTTHFSYIESEDGIHWKPPYKELLEIYGFPFSVTDGGPDDPDPARRYKLTFWETSDPHVSHLKDGHAGVGVAFSPDGVNWTKYRPHPVLPDLWKHSVAGDPQKKGDIKWRDYAADCLVSAWDPLRKLHVGYVKSWTWPPDEMGYISSSSDGMGRRLTSLTTSPDFVHWSTPARSGLPWADDFPSLEFYGCRPKPRGNQMLILTCILDEMKRTREQSHGIGYTVLSTSTDLVHWNRMKEPWLNRSAEDPKGPDHAMAWVADVITVGEEEYIYYGAYSRGHKDFSDRTLMLARLRKDGFVSRDAGREPGRLVTPLLRLNCEKMTVNAHVQGELRLSLVAEDGKAVSGFSTADIAPILGNSTSHAVRTSGSLAGLRGLPVRLEFALRDTDLYGFELD